MSAHGIGSCATFLPFGKSNKLINYSDKNQMERVGEVRIKYHNSGILFNILF